MTYIVFNLYLANVIIALLSPLFIRAYNTIYSKRISIFSYSSVPAGLENSINAMWFNLCISCVAVMALACWKDSAVIFLLLAHILYTLLVPLPPYLKICVERKREKAKNGRE